MSLGSITLHPWSKDEQQLSPCLIHRHLCTKIVAFTAQQTRPTSGGHSVGCSLTISDRQNRSHIYFAAFMVPELVPWTGESITHFDELECVEGQLVYAAKISTSTQVIVSRVSSEQSAQFPTHRITVADSDLQSAHSSSGKQHRPLLSPAVLSAVFGFAGSVFGDTPSTDIAVVESDSASLHINSALPPVNGFGALLITGPSGSGTTTLAHSIAAKYGAASICVSTGALYASSTRNFSRDWAQQQVLSNVMEAVALRRSVLVFDDLHFLAPRRGGNSSSDSGSEDRSAATGVGVGAGSSAGHTDAEEGFIEVSCVHFRAILW